MSAANLWSEYDSAADWCAARGIKGEQGDPLPPMISTLCLAEIDADPEAFQQRVRDSAYARAMSRSDGLRVCPICSCDTTEHKRHCDFCGEPS